jgi:uncharacterized protein YjlB
MELRFFLIALSLLSMNNLNAQTNNKTELVTIQFFENGNFPNNQNLPVLLYKNVYHFETNDPASLVEQKFKENSWGGSWRNGIFAYHHYHSTAHEALGVYMGWAEVQLGGPGNDTIRIEKGDLVVLPAGTSHKRIDSGDGFAVVGAYPDSQTYDMNYGKEDEFNEAKDNISRVPLPTSDPVFGKDGVMFDHWK